jgi:hypothetical protein
MHFRIPVLSIGLILLLTACADDHGEVTDPACDYANLGAMTVVATTDMGTEATAEVHFMEHGHKVTLEAGQGGYVWINVPEDKAGAAGIYIQSVGAVEAFYHDGVERSLGEPVVHPDCGGTFPVFYEVADLAAGTWHIKLAEVVETTEVWIMAIPTAGDSSAHGHADHH